MTAVADEGVLDWFRRSHAVLPRATARELTHAALDLITAGVRWSSSESLCGARRLRSSFLAHDCNYLSVCLCLRVCVCHRVCCSDYRAVIFQLGSENAQKATSTLRKTTCPALRLLAAKKKGTTFARMLWVARWKCYTASTSTPLVELFTMRPSVVAVIEVSAALVVIVFDVEVCIIQSALESSFFNINADDADGVQSCWPSSSEGQNGWSSP